MIQVTYHRSYHALAAQGHAHSGEPGHDLVCAAVSALAYTLAGNVAKLSDSAAVRAPVMKLEPGNAEIRCNPVTRHKATVTLVYDAVCIGFELLAMNYPDYISYEIRR